MVNVTYGYLQPGQGDATDINPLGVDLISTIDGVSVAYGSGDIAWVLTCAALIVFMVRWHSCDFYRLATSTDPVVARSWIPLLWIDTS